MAYHWAIYTGEEDWKSVYKTPMKKLRQGCTYFPKI